MCECEKVKSVNKRVLIILIYYFNMVFGKKILYKKDLIFFLLFYFIIIIFGRKFYNKKLYLIF